MADQHFLVVRAGFNNGIEPMTPRGGSQYFARVTVGVRTLASGTEG